MTTAIIFHEVQDGAVWAKAWKKGPGSRHEKFGKLVLERERSLARPNNVLQSVPMVEVVGVSAASAMAADATLGLTH